MKVRKSYILSCLFMVLSVCGVQAQNANGQVEDLDAKYTKGLLTVGTEAPAFDKLSKGAWTIVDFWATWCPDCRREMPKLKEIYAEYAAKVKVVGVSFDTDTTKLSAYCEANSISWPQYCEGKKWKDTQISKAYNISWLPTMYLIDSSGKVAYTTVEAAKMSAKIQALDKQGLLDK